MPGTGADSSKRAIVAWCLFDWANSAFPTIVTTFLFSAYFTDHVAPDHATGQALWSWANGIAALGIAIASPVLGAIADQGGPPQALAVRAQPDQRRRARRRSGSCARMPATSSSPWSPWPSPPSASSSARSSTTPCCRTSCRDDLLGRVSGWGWGLGYAGGLACLGAQLFRLRRRRPGALRSRPRCGGACPHRHAAGGPVVRAVRAAALPVGARSPGDRPRRRDGRARRRRRADRHAAPGAPPRQHRPLPAGQDDLHRRAQHAVRRRRRSTPPAPSA